MPFKRLMTAMLLMAAMTVAAVAQDAFPSRPIRIIVTFPPGGGPDIMARIVDRHGRVAVHTGSECKTHSSSITGDGYVVMGNYLLTDKVVPAMNQAWLGSTGALFEERLMAGAIAARDEGGDLGGHRSSCMLVYDTESYARTDLRIDFIPKRDGQPDAVDALREILDRWKPMIAYYKVRPHNPSMPGWADWLAAQGTPFRE